MKYEYDVIVVGGGGSGLACAARAAECGADVLLLEKQPQLGGATGIAIGSFTASGTPWQRKAGIEDHPDDHEADAAKFGPPAYQAKNNTDLRRFFLEHAADTLQWLTGLGLVFHGPNPEPPNRVPRMHNVVPNAKAYIAALQSRLVRCGGTIVCDAAVAELLRDGKRIDGVVVRDRDRPAVYRARRGVVLAAGDYANAPDMIARFRGERFAVVEGINPHAAGDGHRLAEQAGARMVNMEITYGPELRFIAPPRDGFAQLLPARGLGKIAYLLLDQRLVERYSRWPHFLSTAPEIAYAYVADYLRLRPDVAVAGRLLDDVAAARGLAAPVVRETVERFNRFAAGTDSDEFGRRSASILMDGERWVLLGPVKAYFTTTEGGAAVNRRMQVVDDRGSPIRGLYAVGQNGLGGMVLWGHGLHIAWAITSGRLVGEALGRQD
jgi:fumarate reductase flavoprotein subunit